MATFSGLGSKASDLEEGAISACRISAASGPV